MPNIIRRAPGAPAIAFAALCALLSACGAAPPEAADHADESHDEDAAHTDVVHLTEDALRAAGVSVEAAQPGSIPVTLSFPAEIEFDPDRLANVSPAVEGTVRSVAVTEGAQVAPGDPLAVISSRELADLKSQFIVAQAAEELARTERTRAEDLFDHDAVSEAELLSARAAHTHASAVRTGAETKLHALGLGHGIIDRLREADDGEHSLFTLTSPIAGRVVRRTLAVGETLQPAEGVSDPVFVIADTSVVWASVAIYESDLAAVAEGAPVELTDDSGRVLAAGTVSFVSPLIDDASRTGAARAVIDNTDGALRPGQFVTARIAAGSAETALRVPTDAVQTVEDAASVFVPEDDGFAPRSVTIGRSGGGFTEILSGLAAGDLYVATGAFTLKAELEKSAFGDGHAH